MKRENILPRCTRQTHRQPPPQHNGLASHTLNAEVHKTMDNKTISPKLMRPHGLVINRLVKIPPTSFTTREAMISQWGNSDKRKRLNFSGKEKGVLWP